jgi:polygalacturonase
MQSFGYAAVVVLFLAACGGGGQGNPPGVPPMAPDAAAPSVDAAVVVTPAADSATADAVASNDVAATPVADAASGEVAPPPAGTFSHPEAVRVPTFPERTCPVTAGAAAAAINDAIAMCSGMGGGVVTFAPGSYSVTSIHMMSNVKLQLNGASLKGAGTDGAEPYTTPIQCQDEGHRHFHNAMIWGENLTNVAIVNGTLDGGGLDSNLQKQIAFKSTTGMLFEDLTQTSTGHFGYLLTDCHDITMARLKMRPSRDGVDLMECTNVNAHDLSIVDGPDDAFALKSDCVLGKALPTDNVTVTNSTIGSGDNALQFGSETWGDFQNISWSHIKVVKGGKSGIGIQMNDGSVVRNVSYDDITMTGTSFPIVISVTSLLRAPTKVVGHAENIRISNVTADGIVAGNNRSPQDTAIVISAEAGSPHLGVVLEHVKVSFPGGGNAGGDPPEGMQLNAGAQWNPRFLTPLPAYGLFIRHAHGVELHDVQFIIGAAEQRPAVVARDVDGLVLDGFTAQKGSALLELDAVKNATFKGSAPLPEGTMATVDKMTF